MQRVAIEVKQAGDAVEADIRHRDQARAERHRQRRGCAVWRNPENALVPGIAKTALVVILRNGLNPRDRTRGKKAKHPRPVVGRLPVQGVHRLSFCIYLSINRKIALRLAFIFLLSPGRHFAKVSPLLTGMGIYCVYWIRLRHRKLLGCDNAKRTTAAPENGKRQYAVAVNALCAHA